MPKRPSSQTELDFTDFVHAPPPSVSDAPEDDLPPETQPRKVREAIAEGLRQAQAGEFANEDAIEAIFRRAGA